MWGLFVLESGGADLPFHVLLKLPPPKRSQQELQRPPVSASAGSEIVLEASTSFATAPTPSLVPPIAGPSSRPRPRPVTAPKPGPASIQKRKASVSSSVFLSSSFANHELGFLRKWTSQPLCLIHPTFVNILC